MLHPLLAVPTFLFGQGWRGALFALLLLAGAATALAAFRNDPLQRGVRHTGFLLLRLAATALWWLQTATPGPGAPARWTERANMPPDSWTAALVHTAALVIAVSLALGLFTRLGALIGTALVLVLWATTPGLGSDAGALLVLMLAFALDPPGRSLGLDAILLRRRGQNRVLPFNWRRARRQPAP